MDLIRDASIDPAPLLGKRIAILGYGNQGRAQALNLKDSGHEVTIGLRVDSASFERVQADDLPAMKLVDAVAAADVVVFLAPDESLAAIYDQVAPALRQGAAIGFSHGLAIRFEFINPRSDLDVFMVAPKGPGTALRSLYEQGRGMLALFAVHQDSSGRAEGIALAYGRAIGCGRAGLMKTSFAEECEADLFNEQAVVWGAIPAILAAGFDTLVEAGIRPEIAYMECVGELSLLAQLVEQRGLAGMREAISNTAELGAVTGGEKLVDQAMRDRMRAILADIRAGGFASLLKDEEASGYPRLRAERISARSLLIEQVRQRLDFARD